MSGPQIAGVAGLHSERFAGGGTFVLNKRG